MDGITDTGISTPTDASSGGVSSSPASGPASAPSEPMSTGDFFANWHNQNEEPAQADPAQAAQPAATDQQQEGDGSTAVEEAEVDPSTLPTEKVIEDLRATRQLKKQLEQELRGFKPIAEKAKEYGIDEALYEPSFQLMQGLLGSEQRPSYKDGQPQYDPQTGQAIMEDVPTTFQFWNSLSELSQPHLLQMLHDAPRFFPDEMAEYLPKEVALRSLGIEQKDWQAFQEFQQNGAQYSAPSATYDPEIAKSLPGDLVDVYRHADPELQNELNLLTDEGKTAIRNEILTLKAGQIRAEQEKKQAAERARYEQQDQLKQAEDKRISDFAQQQEQAFLGDLQKSWLPYGPGPENEQKNARVHRAVYQDVTRAMYSDPKTFGKIQALDKAIRANNAFAREQIMTQLRVDIARLRNDAIEFYGAPYRATNGQLQQQRDASNSLQQVTHTGGFPENRQPEQLPEGGDTQANIRSLAGRLGIRLA